jgi:hypothetical protein
MFYKNAQPRLSLIDVAHLINKTQRVRRFQKEKSLFFLKLVMRKFLVDGTLEKVSRCF